MSSKTRTNLPLRHLGYLDVGWQGAVLFALATAPGVLLSGKAQALPQQRHEA